MTSHVDIEFPPDLDMTIEREAASAHPRNLDHVNNRDGMITLANRENSTHPWPPKLIIDLALGLDDIETILARHEFPISSYNALKDNPLFRRDLYNATKELQENGVTFKRKAALQAELYLEDMDTLMRNDLTPPSVKKDIFIHMAKLGELEPDKKGDGKYDGMPTFAIQINL